ncbi:MAG TPA: family 78 glycoside hydrolase catalytic domain, partial [Acidimicrobiales bacterium]|nr:family 78 glycoside hydrolase catalytic domain [Acidimicrobiales bacterium]
MSTEPLSPVELRCAYKDSPLAVEIDRVRLAWKLAGSGRSRRQSAYQIVVHEADAPMADAPIEAVVFDSGRVEADTTCDVAVPAASLAPARRYAWRVRVWDEEGRAGPWSAPSTFETALGGAPAWKSCWIGLGRDSERFDVPSGEDLVDTVVLAMKPAPYLRRAFTVDGAVGRARLYATALGIYELFLNGLRVSENLFAPGWTDYNRRLLYQTYDVTALLEPGENVLAAVVADGWACGFFGFDGKRRGAHYASTPQLLAQLVIGFAGGSEQLVGTDGRWRSSTGSIVYADLLMGERHDPAREPRGWQRPGFDDSSWRPVICRDVDSALLVADPGPPVRIAGTLPAASLVRRLDGTWIADFGQNTTGFVELETTSPAGDLVEVRHGEMLDADGSLYVDNLRTARQKDSYVATGAAETLAPRFTFHGFRYAELSGLGADVRPEDVRGRVVHSDTTPSGHFECSSPSVNRLVSNIDWGQRCNFLSIPTDCPQRDERLGWLGDAQVFVRTATYNRDVGAFFSKWLDDVADAQHPSGAYSDFAPRLGSDWAGAPAWADAGVIVPWTIYKMYGDTSVLLRHFGAMTAWMDLLSAGNPDRLRRNGLGNSYGDWLAPVRDDTPPELLATAYWAHDATLMSEIAGVIGRPEEGRRYAALAGEIRHAFQQA